MSISVALQKKDEKVLKEMDAYIAALKKQPANIGKQESMEALKRTGVITSRGKVKKQIVTWG